jgi:hypothetical protein
MSDIYDDARFRGWLAGFIDGEGCFEVRRSRSQSPCWICTHRIALRADDLPLLMSLQGTTGLGRVIGPYARRFGRPGARPFAEWRIAARRECVALRDILRESPLKSKKARDLAIWSEALDAWGRRDWDVMERLAAEIREVRLWVEKDLVQQLPSVPSHSSPALPGFADV